MSIEDDAQDHEIRQWELRNAPRAQRRIFQPGEDGYGPEECDRCGEDMPALRRANGWVLCTSCQSRLERVGPR